MRKMAAGVECAGLAETETKAGASGRMLC